MNIPDFLTPFLMVSLLFLAYQTKSTNFNFQIMTEITTIILAMALLGFMGPSRYDQVVGLDHMTSGSASVGPSLRNKDTPVLDESLHVKLGECSGVG